MRKAGVGAVLALLGGPLARATPPDSLSARTLGRRATPVTIDSEASLEFFIGMASRLVHDDTGKQFAALTGQLAALKAQKQALAQKIVAVQAQAPGKAGADLQALNEQVQVLKAQLAKIDVEIKEILARIDRIREEEEREKEDIRRSQEILERLLDALMNAERARTEMMGAVSSLNTFARGLSPAKRRDLEVKARAALAQFAEARRVRVSRLSSFSSLHPAAKPLTVK